MQESHVNICKRNIDQESLSEGKEEANYLDPGVGQATEEKRTKKKTRHFCVSLLLFSPHAPNNISSPH